MTMVEDTLRRSQKQRKTENSQEIAALVRQLKENSKDLAQQDRLDEAILFGSALSPEMFHGESDLDIALGGVTPEDSWTVVSELARGINRELDVQFLEDMPEKWAENVREEGIQLD
jgi:predicted nucleotidyltransferase